MIDEKAKCRFSDVDGTPVGGGGGLGGLLGTATKHHATREDGGLAAVVWGDISPGGVDIDLSAAGSLSAGLPVAAGG